MKEFPWEDDLYDSDDDDTEKVKEKKQIDIDLNEPIDICPIDTLVLSVFRGNYIHPSCVGPVFPPLSRVG